MAVEMYNGIPIYIYGLIWSYMFTLFLGVCTHMHACAHTHARTHIRTCTEHTHPQTHIHIHNILIVTLCITVAGEL